MNELIRIEHRELAGASHATVDARELHEFLGVGRDFSSWIKERIEQYGFDQGRDFEVFPDSGENPQGGRPTKEYALTLNMAKELSMVERNQRGKDARSYFLECERRARPGVAATSASLSRLQLLTMALEAEQERLSLSARVDELSPKAEALDRIASTAGSFCITDAAKQLQIKPRALVQFLQSENWAYRRPGAEGLHAYQSRINSGDLIHKQVAIGEPGTRQRSVDQLRITPKGAARLAELLQRLGSSSSVSSVGSG